jgi:hypothetical protein
MPQVISLSDRTISEEELVRLAEFTVLWPAELPDHFRLTRIAEMSESQTESTRSGIFIFEFGKDQEHWISIRQTTKQMKPELEKLRRTDTISLPDSEIALYEIGPSVGVAFLERDGINIKFLTRGMSPEEIATLISSLHKRQPPNQI